MLGPFLFLSTKKAHPMLMSLMDVLDIVDCKSVATSHMEDIQHRFLERNRGLLQLVLAAADESLRQNTLSIYNELDDLSRARVLLSAELGEIFAGLGEPNRTYAENVAASAPRLYALVAGEHAIAQLELGRHTPYLDGESRPDIWSPLADRVAKYIDGSWQVIRSMNVGGCITLDFDSPLATRTDPTSGVMSQPRLVMDHEERSTLQCKLDAALDMIDAIEPTYGVLIRNFTRRIIVRKSAETLARAAANGRRFSSEHSSNQRGVIKLLNFHFPEKSAGACTESLLHESLHVMLASYEHFTSSFTSRQRATRPVSPWSGNLIPNSSLSHAIFIYYACHRLFNIGASSDSPLFDVVKSEMRAKIQHFAAGFLISQPLSKLFVDSSPIGAELQEVLDLMQRRTRAFYLERCQGVD
ncbi:MAG TPA: hypothetical protein VNO21_21710 [Polyangiaceae bacterium]|nr:hypothetical protein [Polyangiaceae bacterium]